MNKRERCVWRSAGLRVSSDMGSWASGPPHRRSRKTAPSWEGAAAGSADGSDPRRMHHGPARGQPLHGVRDAVRAMVGEAIFEAGPGRHHRLRRIARYRSQENPEREE